MFSNRLRRALPAALIASLLSLPLAACGGAGPIPDEQRVTDDEPQPVAPGDDEGDTGEYIEDTVDDES